MTFSYKYNLRDFHQFHLAHNQLKRTRWFNLSFGMLFALQTLLSMLLGWEKYLVIINAVLAVIVCFPQPIIFLSCYLSYKKLKKYQRQMTINLTTKQVKMDTEHSKVSSDWQHFLYYLIYKDKLVALYIDPKHAIIIPKRVVKKDDWPKLIELVTSNVQPKVPQKQTFKNMLKILFLLGFFFLLISEVRLLLDKKQLQRNSQINDLQQKVQNLQQEKWKLEQEVGMTQEEIVAAKAEMQKKVIIFFKPEASETSILELKTKLESYQLTSSIVYTSQEQAAQDFAESNQDDPDLKDLFANQDLVNILPASLEIETENKAAILGLLNELKDKYQIEHIQSFELND